MQMAIYLTFRIQFKKKNGQKETLVSKIKAFRGIAVY